MKILLSAGHTNKSGSDRGAAGNGFIEGVEATKLRDRTAEYVRELDSSIEVLEDGADGINDPLRKAVALAKQANVAVEFHFNASASAKATGVEVLAKPKNKKLAQKLASAIADATGLKLRGESGYKADNSGQHHRLAFCEAGGLIIEVCFISNPSDMEKYRENFDEICLGVAEVLSGKTSAATSEIPLRTDLTPLKSGAVVTGGTAEQPETSQNRAADQNPPAPDTTKVSVTDGNVKVETSSTETPQEKVAVVGRDKQSFFANIWKKITAWFGGTVTADVVTEKASQANALGLSPETWNRIFYIALIAGLIYIAKEFYGHWQWKREQDGLTKLLVESNSTAENKVVIANPAEVENFRAAGYKIVYRGEKI